MKLLLGCAAVLSSCLPAHRVADQWTVYATESQPAEWVPHASGDLVTDGEVLRTAWVRDGRIDVLGGHGWGNRFHSAETVTVPYQFRGEFKVNSGPLPRCGEVIDRRSCHTATWTPGLTLYATWVDDDNNVAIGFRMGADRVNAFKEIGHRYGGVDGLFKPHYRDGVIDLEYGEWYDFHLVHEECGRYQLWIDGILVIDTVDPKPRWCVGVHVGWRVDFHDIEFRGMTVE